MGAALAFYSAFSLAPLLLIVIAIAGFVYGADAARKAVVKQFAELIGPVGADAVGALLKAASTAETSGIATAIGVVLLLIGATTVLVELETDLDRIWEAPERKENGLVSLLRVRLLSFGMILGIGFLLIVSLVAGSAIAATSRWSSLTGIRWRRLRRRVGAGVRPPRLAGHPWAGRDLATGRSACHRPGKR